MGKSAFSKMLSKKRESNFSALTDKVKGENQKKQSDPTYWKPTWDDSGTVFSIIRLLPTSYAETKGDDYVKVTKHYMYDPKTKKKYDELNAKDKHGSDPVEDHFWSIMTDKSLDKEEKKKRAGKFRPQTKYHVNIVVLHDPVHPENEGKVFRFQMGMKLFEKISEKITPSNAVETPVYLFDMEEGCNIKIKGKRDKFGQNEYANIDNTEFDAPSVLFDGDEEKMKEAFDAMYDLSELVSDDKYKSLDELKSLFNAYMGTSDDTNRGIPMTAEEEDEAEEEEAVEVEETSYDVEDTSDDVEEDKEESQDDDEDAWLDDLLND